MPLVFKPDSSEELNDIIEYFYTNYKLYYLEANCCWIISYGVEIDPNEKKVWEYPIKANGNGGRVMIIFLENILVLDLLPLESMATHFQIQIISKNCVIGIQL